MDSILVIAGIVFRENLRKKIIHVFFIIALILLFLLSTFNVFDLGVQVKFLKDYALFFISLIGLLITVTTTAGQLSNEIEQRTIYPLLAKPVSRWQVLVGKFLGAIYIIYLNILLLGIIFLGLLYRQEQIFDVVIAEAILLIAVECAILASICLLFSTFFSTAANVSSTILIYLLGHVKYAYGDYAAMQFDSPFIKVLVKLLKNPVFPPDLDNFNIRDAIVSGVRIVPFHLLLIILLYGIGLIVFYLLFANIIFTKKDL